MWRKKCAEISSGNVDFGRKIGTRAEDVAVDKINSNLFRMDDCEGV